MKFKEIKREIKKEVQGNQKEKLIKIPIEKKEMQGNQKEKILESKPINAIEASLNYDNISRIIDRDTVG